MGIQSIRIKNFKSIRDSGELRLRPLNILIGANGAGKSNFIGFFKFLHQLYEQRLPLYVSQNGRADNFLYFGQKQSSSLGGKVIFDNDHRNQYEFEMVPDQSGNLIFSKETSGYSTQNMELHGLPPRIQDIGSLGSLQSNLKTSHGQAIDYLKSHFQSFKLFHFHDTSFHSKIKQPSTTTDYAYLQEDGSNIAAFLRRLQQSTPTYFQFIEKVVQSIAPFFDRFYLVPDEINPNQIYLRWLEKGSDLLFSAHNLSDGTLRMICLTTLLMQPELPETIVIDEPELGLHPSAVSKLAGMLKSASANSQIILSTQSVNLVNEFDAEDIIVVERADNQTVFKRQSSAELENWLDLYSMGDLWEKNVLGGRPQ